MKNISEFELAAAMQKIIAKFKQMPQGFSCAEHDALGMYNFLTRQESLGIEPQWKKSFADMQTEISLVKSYIEFEKHAQFALSA